MPSSWCADNMRWACTGAASCLRQLPDAAAPTRVTDSGNGVAAFAISTVSAASAPAWMSGTERGAGHIAFTVNMEEMFAVSGLRRLLRFSFPVRLWSAEEEYAREVKGRIRGAKACTV